LGKSDLLSKILHWRRLKQKIFFGEKLRLTDNNLYQFGPEIIESHYDILTERVKIEMIRHVNYLDEQLKINRPDCLNEMLNDINTYSQTFYGLNIILLESSL
jgi:hypothetical protein